jgi:hypothetical protein
MLCKLHFVHMRSSSAAQRALQRQNWPQQRCPVSTEWGPKNACTLACLHATLGAKDA